MVNIIDEIPRNGRENWLALLPETINVKDPLIARFIRVMRYEMGLPTIQINIVK